MNPLVKIPRPLLMQALNDLERPHAFAAERLGFLSFRQSLAGRTPSLLCYDYHPIPDAHYVPDETCGARIGGDAIRAAMSRSFGERSGQLWIHTHGRRGYPTASPTDLAEGPRVVRSLSNVRATTLQGWAVLSEIGIFGQVRMPNAAMLDLRDLSVVGYPMVIPLRTLEPNVRFDLFSLFRHRESKDRYARQSFLGRDAQSIIERSRIGVIGLCGGGSHICQQLAHVGFQKFVLCDEDRVDFTNLNRLVGATLKDARRKRLKTEISSRLIRHLQPAAELDDRPLRWEDKRDALRECDLIFGCVDSFRARRDLEAFCRSMMIPFIDIGMAVLRDGRPHPEICGQTVVSMPGEMCMHCLQVLTPENLAREAEDYNAGAHPQVVWPNGALASTAIGQAMLLLTGWAGDGRPKCRTDYRGSQLTVAPSNLVSALSSTPCRHYPLGQMGDPVFRTL